MATVRYLLKDVDAWDRFVIEARDIDAVLCEDPSGNPIELFEQRR